MVSDAGHFFRSEEEGWLKLAQCFIIPSKRRLGHWLRAKDFEYRKTMSLNRKNLIKQMNEASSVVLREKGYIGFVDVLIQMGKLTKDDYEAWRLGKVTCLEEVISVNLAKVNHMLRTLHRNCRNGNLHPSSTAYLSWGKGPKRPLRFSKSGDPNIEEAYSTHFLRPRDGYVKEGNRREASERGQ